jgi:hypothetical protein
MAEWLEGRPPIIQKLARSHPPYKLFLLKSTADETRGYPGQRVWVVSMNENGTVTVCVSKWFNRVGMERQVFGIKPEDLEECDLPLEGEIVGCGNLTTDDARAIIQNRATFAERIQEKNVEMLRFNKATAALDILGAS